MFAHSLKIYGFKCFGKAQLDLNYPGVHEEKKQFDNINLILGDNGGGKSTVLESDSKLYVS
jgi:DNA repair exonuclease SbcCD ATPase subunit